MPVGDAAACAALVIDDLAESAWRRPPSETETSELVTVFVGAYDNADIDTEDAGPNADLTPAEIRLESGISALAETLLLSPSFLYVTELGLPDTTKTVEPYGDVVELGPYEIAAAISLLMTSGPPDTKLLKAAENGQLTDPDVRRQQAQRLWQAEGKPQVQRFVKEWLGIGRPVANRQKQRCLS